MRLLFTSRASLGHLQPLLPLAKAARAAGHQVVFATGAKAASVPVSLGFPTDIVGLDFSTEFFQALQTEKPLRTEIRRFAFTRFFAGKELEPRLRDIEVNCLSRRPNIIVHEVAELAAPIAAALAGVPVVTVGFGPLLDPDVAEAAGLAAEPFWRARGLSLPRWAGLYRDLYVDPCPPSLQIRAIDELPAVQKMGPGIPTSHVSPEWMSDVSAPLVYVTFGTIFNRDHKLFRKVLDALETLPIEIVVTVGENNDPADFGPRPKTTRVFRFIPQERLLPHCRAIVAHGGAGTLLGALAYGAPMLLLPQSADQFYNASRATAAGTALSLMPENVSARAITTSFAQILNDPAFAACARAVGAQMVTMPRPEEALARIEQLHH
jgi:UDP:flavonoid glycosyltransferase YjiC (YdhE family)